MNSPSTTPVTLAYLHTRAALLQKHLGTRVAASYLKHTGVPLKQAVAILARTHH